MISANGRWELRYTNTLSISASGPGQGSSRYDLVELATGHRVRSWSGNEISSMHWDGDTLVFVDDHGTEQRISPGH